MKLLKPFCPYLFPDAGIIWDWRKKFKVTRKGNDSSWTYISMPFLMSSSGDLMYGLITFNYGKFGSELFYGSIISFWLMYHIVNLTFAIFCAIGRRFIVIVNVLSG